MITKLSDLPGAASIDQQIITKARQPTTFQDLDLNPAAALSITTHHGVTNPAVRLVGQRPAIIDPRADGRRLRRLGCLRSSEQQSQRARGDQETLPCLLVKWKSRSSIDGTTTEPPSRQPLETAVNSSVSPSQRLNASRIDSVKRIVAKPPTG